MLKPLLLALSLALAAATGVNAAGLAASDIAPPGSWHDLRSPQQIWPCPGAIYYSFSLPGGSRAHLIVVDLKSGLWQVRPAVAPTGTSPTSTIANGENASAAVNGGYFNLKGDIGASASYVVINSVTVGDPTKNKSLMDNQKLKPFLNQVLNRSEVRFLHDAHGDLVVQIAKHNEPVPSGAKLIHSLQAGPRLLPSIDAEEEAFIRTNPDGTVSDSISARKEAARTAFGITPDGYAMLLSVAGKGQDPESSGLSLQELASVLKQLGCCDALNLDGGASSTMFVRIPVAGASINDNMTPPGTVVCGKSPETLVKSILMIQPSSNRRRR